jgi:tyrosine-protein phosphatase YwqE
VIDLHSHLLPGIDDGPAHLDEALAMAQIAVADGIGFAVLAFAIALVLRAYHKTGSDDLDTFQKSDS